MLESRVRESRGKLDTKETVTATSLAHASSPQGTLFLVAMPIGNLEDISLRALRILREVSLIVAEDVRVAHKFLAHYGITTELLGYQSREGRESVALLLERLRQGESVAFVTDAGTPSIADPGLVPVLKAIEAGIKVVSLPGPVAAIVGLIASGLPTGKFVFEGFPPRSKADRRAFFHALADEPRTLLLYESPAYLRSTLQALQHSLGATRQAVVVRDLTKPTETFWRGTLAELTGSLLVPPPRGEYTLVVRGKPIS